MTSASMTAAYGCRQVAGRVRRVGSEAQARELASDVVRSDRVYPIVGLSCTYRSRHPPIPPGRVREVVWESVPVYVIESREARVLDRLLWGIAAYNGAARVWWPGVDEDSDPRQHPLIYDSTGKYGESAVESLAEVFAHRAPESVAELSPQERAVLQLRSVPRPELVDTTPLVGRVIPLSTRKDLRRLTSELRSQRDYPIVVLTVDGLSEQTAFPPGDVRTVLDPHIPVYVLGTDDLCRRLADGVGEALAVDGGDARVFWALSDGAEEAPEHHPLVPARCLGDPRDGAQRLLSALELSRPSVRAHVAGLQERARGSEQRATNATQALGETRGELAAARANATRAEEAAAAAEQQLQALSLAGLDRGELDLIAGLDADGRLHRLINREWLRSLPAGERDTYPLRYTFGPGFVRSVQELDGTAVERIAWVAAMVACDRAKDLAGVDPHALRSGRSGATGQVVRADAKAWVCKLNGAGASRLHFWARDDGIRELATVTVHDAIGEGV